jgi:UDP-glucose 4-epimerase
MAVLVIGGAGYIGANTVRYLKEKNMDVIVFDNLSTGHKKAVEGTKLYEKDIRKIEDLKEVFEKENIDSVINFASFTAVGDSMENPDKYFYNNVYGMMNILEVMKEYKVDKLVFSSSAAVYGEVTENPVREDSPLNPANPYGESKLMMEKMCKWFDHAYGIRYVALRYFNAAGAWPGGELGVDRENETLLIPVTLETAQGKRDEVLVFGDDYDTKDGSGVRDYIHVYDLASAHYLALKYLEEGNKSDIFNLGNGTGQSVLEVIDTASQVVGFKINSRIVERRPGDPSVVIASSDKAIEKLKRKPERNDLKDIISDAWAFMEKYPKGYKDR